MAIQITLDHHATLIVQAGFDYGYGCNAVFIRSSDQIGIGIAFRLNAYRSEGQGKLSRLHLNLSGRWQRRQHLDYDVAKEVVRSVLVVRSFAR